MSDQWENLEGDLALRIARDARARALDQMGEMPDEPGHWFVVPLWATLAAREILARIVTANGGCLADAIWAIASGREADREFAVPVAAIPLADPSHVIETTGGMVASASVPSGFRQWLRDPLARVIG